MIWLCESLCLGGRVRTDFQVHLVFLVACVICWGPPRCSACGTKYVSGPVFFGNHSQTNSRTHKTVVPFTPQSSRLVSSRLVGMSSAPVADILLVVSSVPVTGILLVVSSVPVGVPSAVSSVPVTGIVLLAVFCLRDWLTRGCGSVLSRM